MPVQSDMIIKLLNGNERHGILQQEFDPTSGHIDFFCKTEQRHGLIPLDDICFIKFLGTPNPPDPSLEESIVQNITTLTGDRFHVRLGKDCRDSSRGFFGQPAASDADFKSIYFTAKGCRNRSHDQPLGEILNKLGLVQEADVAEALQEQKHLRGRRVGEILADQAEIPQPYLEQAIDKITGKGHKKTQLRVGEILIEAGLVTRQQIDEALLKQSLGKRKQIGRILIERGLINENQLLVALAEKFRLDFVNLDEIAISQEALGKVPQSMIERMQILPIALHDTRLTVATATPTDHTISESLRFATNCQIELVCARSTQIGEKIAALFDRGEDTIKDLINELAEVVVEDGEVPELDTITESDSKVIKLVNKVLLDAHNKGVSDIHFEPGLGPQPLRIRYRKDGICYTVHQIAASYKKAVISRLKIVARLDIAERRRPQTGKIVLRKNDKRIEYRVEITPTIGGQEDAVLRVLSSVRGYSLDELGFSASNRQRFKKLLRKPYGIILCVGPTGSGKTTTLHSALAEINTPDTKIWTAEDPVEITQNGLRQVQVNAKIGFTFEEALRSFLRADPDVIMIGEMRDSSTAKTAIGASLTGHLVFSTLHTNNAPETVVRLIEMGIDPFNCSDALLCILAQRLARRLCKQCKEPYHPSREEYATYVEVYGAREFQEDDMPEFSEDLTLMRKVGCEACEGQGYSGRIAIQELLVNSPEIKRAIKYNSKVEEISEIAISQGMRNLRMDGIQKIFQGLTDLHQVNQVYI